MKNERKFKEGDRVTVTATFREGSDFHVSSKKGIIVYLHHAADFAIIKYQDGQRATAPFDSIRKGDQPSELMERLKPVEAPETKPEKLTWDIENCEKE